jgi:hypothetical protein
MGLYHSTDRFPLTSVAVQDVLCGLLANIGQEKSSAWAVLVTKKKNSARADANLFVRVAQTLPVAHDSVSDEIVVILLMIRIPAELSRGNVVCVRS